MAWIFSKKLISDWNSLQEGGGGILGSEILGIKTIGAVEIEKYPCGILMQRQNDGSLDPFPIWTDVKSFTKRNNEVRPYIKTIKRISHMLLISGGFPCQDISVAGKGEGIEGENSGLWKEYKRIIGEIRPLAAYLENSPMLTSRGINRVLGDLAELGYNAIWGVLGASDIGANHYRKRIWILGYSNNYGSSSTYGKAKKAKSQIETGEIGQFKFKGAGNISNGTNPNCVNDNHSGFRTGKISQQQKAKVFGYSTDPNLSGSQRHGKCREGQKRKDSKRHIRSSGGAGYRYEVESGVLRVTDVVAHRVDRIKSIGNGQVPACMAGAFSILNEILK